MLHVRTIDWFFIILILIIGLLNLLKPDLSWKMSARFYVKEGEPTKFYLTGARVAGAIALVFDVFLFLKLSHILR